MSRVKRQQFIRKWHRRLGPIIGIQLFLWSLGGFYFSWIHVTLVQGERDMDLAGAGPNLKYENYLAPIAPLLRISKLARVERITLGKLLEVPVYRFIQDKDLAELYNAITGDILSPIDRQTAVAIAERDFAPEIPVSSVSLIEQRQGEYQGPLPAYRVEFEQWKSPTVFIHANSGTITARRNLLWRLYNVLWMVHIMDFQDQTDVNNWLIRALSILGLTTIASGYYLWYLTVPAGRTRQPSRKPRRRKP